MLQNTLTLYRNAYAGLSREVWLLAIISLINRAGTMVFPFMTIYLTQSRHFTLKEAGIIMSFFGLGSLLGAYLGGWLTDRIGEYKVQFWSLIGTSVVLLFILKMETFWGIAAMAFLLSLVADAFRPANKVAVSNYSKPENMTRSFALLRLAVNLGFAIGPAMGGILAAWKGYDWLFYADAITCFLAALLLRLTLKDNFKSRQAVMAAKTSPQATLPLNSPYKDRHFLYFLIIIGLLAFAFLQIFYTIPVFFKQDLGLDEAQIGLFMGLNGLIIVLLEMPMVYKAEQKYTKFYTMKLGAVLIGLGFLCFLIPAATFAAALGIIILTIGEIYYMPFASAWVASRSSEANRGQYMALYTIAWATASVIAPSAGFLIIEQLGFNGLWLILATIGLLGAFGFGVLGRRVESADGRVQVSSLRSSEQ